MLEHEEAAQDADDLVATKVKTLNVKQEVRKKITTKEGIVVKIVVKEKQTDTLI